VPSSSHVQHINNGQNGASHSTTTVYVIDGLLDMMLSVHAVHDFDLRMAACECLKAYFFNHPDVRLHFLKRAIEGHEAGADETANVLTTLLRPTVATSALSADPYRHWFAAVIMLHLVHENSAAKALAMAVTEGDESRGEEVVTSIQTISAHLLEALSSGEDPRIATGYLMLLLCWLFEDLDGVNDFLGEASNLQGLMEATVRNLGDGLKGEEAIIQGLCAMLLGVAYEFSTKDSAIPRPSLHTLLLKGMGRDRYRHKMETVRRSPWLRDFEVLPQRLDPSTGQRLPNVFFEAVFVDFFKDNYRRLLQAIDRDAGIEIPVMANGVQKGISREMVDSLRADVEQLSRTLQETQENVSSLEHRLGQEMADHRHAKEAAAAELARIKADNEITQKHHMTEIL